MYLLHCPHYTSIFFSKEKTIVILITSRNIEYSIALYNYSNKNTFLALETKRNKFYLPHKENMYFKNYTKPKMCSKS